MKIWAVIVDGKMVAYSESDKPPSNATVFDSWEELASNFPEQKICEQDKKFATIDRKHNVDQMHAIKAMEAGQVIFNDAIANQVPYLAAWASQKKMNLKDAAQIVWNLHTKGVSNESNRTKQKDEVRQGN